MSDITLLNWIVGIHAVVIIVQQIVRYAYNYLNGGLAEHVICMLRGDIFFNISLR
jgi:hypothetical protein